MNRDLRVPFGYWKTYVTLGWLEGWLLAHHHPEYVRRFLAWLESKGGEIGAGGGWRADGSQPDQPGFAPEGRSFHQNQKYADGFIGACAVDVVRRNTTGGIHWPVRWSDVPAQGTWVARKWGLHANVGTPPGGEPWHIQPIEIDGWVSWMNNGSPAPALGYQLPSDPTPTPTPTPPTKEVIFMGDRIISRVSGSGTIWQSNGVHRYGINSLHHLAVLLAAGAVDGTGKKLAVYPADDARIWQQISVLSLAQLNERLGPEGG